MTIDNTAPFYKARTSSVGLGGDDLLVVRVHRPDPMLKNFLELVKLLCVLDPGLKDLLSCVHLLLGQPVKTLADQIPSGFL